RGNTTAREATERHRRDAGGEAGFAPATREGHMRVGEPGDDAKAAQVGDCRREWWVQRRNQVPDPDDLATGDEQVRPPVVFRGVEIGVGEELERRGWHSPRI